MTPTGGDIPPHHYHHPPPVPPPHQGGRGAVPPHRFHPQGPTPGRPPQPLPQVSPGSGELQMGPQFNHRIAHNQVG